MNHATNLTLFILLTLSGFIAGCETTPKTQTPIYPDLSELPGIPSYSDTESSWDSNTVCWVGVTDDALWINSQPKLSKQYFTNTMIPLLEKQLSKTGYDVKKFKYDYITRKKRLSIQKTILCKSFGMRRTVTNQGACIDLKLTLQVKDYHNPNDQNIAECDIWGRKVLAFGEKMSWIDIYKEFLGNLPKVKEFRQALETY